MISKLFKEGGGAGIGSYILVLRNGELDSRTNYLAVRGAYDSGDNLYLSIIDDDTSEALLPLTGWVDKNNKLHLLGRDFDDDVTYKIDVSFHKIAYQAMEGISIGSRNLDDYKEVFQYPTFGDFPEEGRREAIYIDEETDTVYRWATNAYVAIGGGGSIQIKTINGVSIIGFGDVLITSVEGYYYAGVFWKEAAHINRIPDSPGKLYFDKQSEKYYVYDSSTQRFRSFDPKDYAPELAIPDSGEAGIVKLYSQLGEAIDGTLTQKAISDSLNRKVELDMSEAGTDECLGLRTGEIQTI